MGQLVFQATLGGQVNLVGPNTASTFNLNVPAIAGTLITSGDTGTVTNTMLAGSIANAKLTNSSVTIGSTNVALGATSSTLDAVTIGSTTPAAVTGTIVKSTTNFTFQDNSTQNTAATGFGFKNRIINGAMMIDQRNAGASFTPASGASYGLDRYRYYLTQSSKLTSQQSSTAPAGFINSLLVTSSSAYSVLSTDIFQVSQPIEGLNMADLAWGTASAATVTLSFWVRSSLTGTFGGSIGNSSGGRSYVFSYVINSANTWEQKSITITGDTTGTWLMTNGVGAYVNFGLGVGSSNSNTAGAWYGGAYNSATGATSVVGTNGATFYITGVQLEKGSTATSFDYRPYGTELTLCQRYYYQKTDSSQNAAFHPTANSSVTESRGSWQFPVTMRASPTITSSAAGNFWVQTGGGSSTVSAVSANSPTVDGVYMIYTVSTVSLGFAGTLIRQTGTAYLAASAEL